MIAVNYTGLTPGRVEEPADYAIIHVLNTGIFPAKILLSVANDYDTIITELKKQGCEEWAMGLRDDKELIKSGKCFALKRQYEAERGIVTLFYIIFTDPFHFSDYEMCKLAHEVLHICQFMLPDMLDMEREYEAVAYTHTHIMMQCLDVMRGPKNTTA